ncbi:MAG: UDP-N-acetylglucosamine--N-acetylmuramyl-(pentapeptide) pyrophosphoryl-undecaprenol N-acetylglucosamine transferase [Candidatus Pacebacteria bacterium]|nr:UDP-N-acetylglucosamine--N-acetylmuramyl-(pentapeptide) pyrophosphoryl-undecaprenol N-acetylglucosamine transferase [Candidatus Paceibacterota bacterium]
MAQDRSEKFLIVFTGGGSGGHVYPLIAVADALKAKLAALNAPYEYIYMGPKDAYATLLAQRGMTMRPIIAGKLRRYLSVMNIIDIPKFFIGFVQALWNLYWIMPDIVFSKGGTGSLPVVIAAWFYRIPVAIHESDAQPGLNNLLSAYFARKIFVSFARAAQYFNPAITKVTGAPLRADLLSGRITKELAKENLGFDPAKPLTLILGGSQGSTRINEFILENLGQLVPLTQVLHQTGIANIAEVQQLSHAALIDAGSDNRYQAVGYFDNNMPVVMSAADLVVTRSGSSVFELAAFALPAILIPLAESANGHQLVDAYEFAKTGAGVVIEEGNLLPGIFFGQLKQILSNDDARAKMSAASGAFFLPGAADAIAGDIIDVVAATG